MEYRRQIAVHCLPLTPVFPLVALLVAIAILIGLLLPAVHAAREAGRRINNRMKRILHPSGFTQCRHGANLPLGTRVSPNLDLPRQPVSLLIKWPIFP